MPKKQHSNRRIGEREVFDRVLERLRTMPFGELDAMLTTDKEGVEYTNMHEVLAEYDREQERKKAEERAA